MQLFLSVEFFFGLLIGLALRASDVERDLLRPSRHLTHVTTSRQRSTMAPR